MPNFVTQRSLYESRERPAKAYSWKIFILSNIVVEIPWNSELKFYNYQTEKIFSNCCHGILSLLLLSGRILSQRRPYRRGQFESWLDVALHSGILPVHVNLRNRHHRRHGSSRDCWQYRQSLVFALSDFLRVSVTYLETLLTLSSRVLATGSSLPGFWVFMYRVSPFAYLVKGILSTGLANASVTCSATELLHFDPPAGQMCGQYMQAYIESVGGSLSNPNAISDCAFCTLTSTNQFLAVFSIDYNQVYVDDHRTLYLIAHFIIDGATLVSCGHILSSTFLRPSFYTG